MMFKVYRVIVFRLLVQLFAKMFVFCRNFILIDEPYVRLQNYML